MINDINMKFKNYFEIDNFNLKKLINDVSNYCIY